MKTRINKAWKCIKNVGFVRAAKRNKNLVSEQKRKRFANLFFGSPFPIGYVRRAQCGEFEKKSPSKYYSFISIGAP